MVNTGAPKGCAVPAQLVTPVIYFINVQIPSQVNKRSCLFMLIVSILPLFLRSVDYALEIFQQCTFLKKKYVYAYSYF